VTKKKKQEKIGLTFNAILLLATKTQIAFVRIYIDYIDYYYLCIIQVYHNVIVIKNVFIIRKYMSLLYYNTFSPDVFLIAVIILYTF